MKKWNTPDVAELNINETANGWDLWWEEGVSTDGKKYFIASNVGQYPGDNGGNNGGNNDGNNTDINS